MTRSIFSLLLILLPLSAQAFSLEDWHSWQTATPAFKSSIEQSRWLPETEIRVHADGQLLYMPDQALTWHWETPQPRIATLDMAGQFLEQAPSEAQTVIASLDSTDDGLPHEQQVGRLLMQLIQGDMAGLREDYHPLLEGERDDWQLILLPRDRTSEAPNRIVATGGRFIESLRVIASNDNELKLTLSTPQHLVDAQVAQHLQTMFGEQPEEPASDETTQAPEEAVADTGTDGEA